MRRATAIIDEDVGVGAGGERGLAPFLGARFASDGGDLGAGLLADFLGGCLQRLLRARGDHEIGPGAAQEHRAGTPQPLPPARRSPFLPLILRSSMSLSSPAVFRAAVIADVEMGRQNAPAATGPRGGTLTRVGGEQAGEAAIPAGRATNSASRRYRDRSASASPAAPERRAPERAATTGIPRSQVIALSASAHGHSRALVHRGERSGLVAHDPAPGRAAAARRRG